MSKTKLRDLIYIALFLILVLLAWAGLAMLPAPQTMQLPGGTQGTQDLTALDFTDTVYRTAPVWDAWPEQLYTPAQLAGDAGTPVPQNTLDFTDTQYGTYRLRLTLPPGITYGVSMWSSDYSMRLYIDGAEVGSVGTPGSTPETTVPRTGEVVYYFTPQGETTEFVAQAANFVHKEGGWPPVLNVGTAENISRMEGLARLKSGLTLGILLTACLYHLAIFLLNRRQRASLVFAGLCLLLAFAAGDFITYAFPGYNWQLVFRLQYVANVLAFTVMVLLIRRLFPGAIHRPVLWASYAASGVYIVLVLLTPTVFFSQALVAFQAVVIAVGAYALVRLAMLVRRGTAKNLLAFLGIVLVVLLSANNMLYKHGLFPEHSLLWQLGRTNPSAMGMVLFVFCYALVLSIEQAEVNRHLEDARMALAEAATRYRILSEEKRNESLPTARLTDFGLTKRESEVALLLLGGKNREEIAQLLDIRMGTVNYHCSNIYRKAGVSSAAEFAGLLVPNGEKQEKKL